MAVFMSAVVYIVFLGWAIVKIKSLYAFIALGGTALIMVCSFIFGLDRSVHPIWPVTLFIAIVMGIGYFFNKGTKEQGE
jgi:hypothetical protein